MAWIMLAFVAVALVMGIVVIVMFLRYAQAESRGAQKNAKTLEDIASRIKRLEAHITGNTTEDK